MSVLSGKNTNIQRLEEGVKKLEQKIDLMQNSLPKLNRFILPQGTETSCLFHITRTICRRSERNVVCFLKNHETMKQFNNVTIIKYLNRLSDLLFIMARKYNPKEILL
jgi:cob(I)alamin adenosyltransferase